MDETRKNRTKYSFKKSSEIRFSSITFYVNIDLEPFRKETITNSWEKDHSNLFKCSEENLYLFQKLSVSDELSDQLIIRV